jgi:hypothetical protein
MWRWGLGMAAALALVAAVPASASHDPMKLTSGEVTLTVSKTGPKSVLFSYTISPKSCDGLPLCYPNFGKPYHISVAAKALSGGPAFRGIPSLVNGLAGCFAGTQPVVVCDSGKRDTDDSTSVLPLSGSFTVKGLWAESSTAQIVVEGFSLNSHQEGVPMPAAPCTAESDAVDRLIALAQADRDELARITFEIREHIAPEVYGHMDKVTEPLWNVALANLFLQDRRAASKFRAHVKELGRAAAALDDCEKGKAAQTSSSTVSACTVTQWRKLANAAVAFKPRDVRALAAKIRAERKAKNTKAVARDLKKLRGILRAELKQIGALQKVLKACT